MVIILKGPIHIHLMLRQMYSNWLLTTVKLLILKHLNNIGY